MAENVEEVEDDLSFVALGDSSGSTPFSGPVLHIPKELLEYQLNLVDPTYDKEELRQAHGALTTAYVALRDKYNRIESENKELKKRYTKPVSTSPNMARRPQSVYGEPSDSANEDLNNILRHPPEIASMRRSHRSKYGSWQVGDIPVENDDKQQYVQFLEKQIASTEEEKKKLEDQLYELKIRISENDLGSSHLKQELSHLEEKLNKMKSENRGLKHRIKALEEENVSLQRQSFDLQRKLTDTRTEKEKAQKQCLKLEEKINMQGKFTCAEDSSLTETSLVDLNTDLQTFKEVVLYQKAVIQRLMFKLNGKYLASPSPKPGEDELGYKQLRTNYKLHQPVLPRQNSSPIPPARIGVEGSYFRSHSQSLENHSHSSPPPPEREYMIRRPTESFGYPDNDPIGCPDNDPIGQQTLPKQQFTLPSTNISWDQNSETLLNIGNSSANSDLSSGSLSNNYQPPAQGGWEDFSAMSNNRNIGERSHSNIARAAGGPLVMERNETAKTTNHRQSQYTDVNLHQEYPNQLVRGPGVAVALNSVALNNHPMACPKPIDAHNLVEMYQDHNKAEVRQVAARQAPVQECPICGEDFSGETQGVFETHVDRCCGQNETTMQPNNTWETDSWKCPVCDETFSKLELSNAQFEAHVEGHLSRPQAAAREADVTEWLCPVCGNAFKKDQWSETKFNQHVNDHFADHNDGQRSIDAAALQFEVVQ